MRLSKPTLVLFVFFIFTVTCVVQMEAVINERVVDAGSGSSSVNVVVSFFDFETSYYHISFLMF